MFDLDGTLIDSVPDLAVAVNAMNEHLGLPARREDEVRHWVGNGVRCLVERSLTGRVDVAPEEALFQSGYALFRQAYGEHVYVDSRLYPGVREGLDYLRRKRYPLACVTNKSSAFTGRVLAAAELQPYFGLTISGDTLAHKKPHPEPLQHAAAHFGVEPASAWMIGDSENDIKAARAAGSVAIGVSYGYNYGRSIAAADPDRLLDSLTELPALLERAA
jgi:phosphoglycolate phosphatase